MKKRLFALLLIIVLMFSSLVLADESLPMEAHDDPEYPDSPAEDFYDTYATDELPSTSSTSGSSTYQKRRTVWQLDPETGELVKVEETVVEEVTEAESSGTTGMLTDEAFLADFWSFFETFFGGEVPETITEDTTDTTTTDTTEDTTSENGTGEEDTTEETTTEITPECTEDENGLVTGVMADGTTSEGEADLCYDIDDEGYPQVVDSCSGKTCILTDVYCNADGFVDMELYEEVDCKDGALYTGEEVAVEAGAECVEQEGAVTGYDRDGYYEEDLVDACYDSDQDYAEVDSCSGGACMQIDFYCDGEGYLAYALAEGVSCEGGVVIEEATTTRVPAYCVEEDGLVYGYYSDGEKVEGESDQCFIETEGGNIDYADSCAGEKCIYVDLYCNGDYVDFEMVQDTECDMTSGTTTSTGEGVYDQEKVSGSTATTTQTPTTTGDEESGFLQSIIDWVLGTFSFLG